MRILFTSMRHTGHFQPIAPFIVAARRAGHDVAVAAPEELSERVAKTRAEFFPFGHPGPEGLGPIWARLRTVPPDEASGIVFREIFAGENVKSALPLLLGTVERFRPAVIVREAME